MIIDIIGLIISFLSLIISTVLTVLIIKQTKNIAKDQLILQNQLNQRQNDFESKQLKMQQRPDRFEAFKTIFKIYNYIACLEMGKKTLDQNTYEQVGAYFKACDQVTQVAVEDINMKLFTGELVVSSHVKPTFEKIRNLFWEMSENIARFYLSELNILTETEKEKEKERLSVIWKYASEISKTNMYITSIIESEISL